MVIKKETTKKKNSKKETTKKNEDQSLEFYKNIDGYKTDKIYYHGYHRFYDYFLSPMKNEKFNLLEIGVDKFGSLLLWYNYFKNAKIFGFDKNKYLSNYSLIKNEYKKNIKIIKGDHTEINDLKNLISVTGKCKLIIDDGSHVPEHQLSNFNYLFKNCLTDGGIYIIEDIETSYWTDGYLYNYKIKSGYKKNNNIVQIFKDIADIVNYPFLLPKNKKKLIKSSKILKENINEIIMISFGTNCIIIKKKSNEDKEFEKKDYKFKNFL